MLNGRVSKRCHCSCSKTLQVHVRGEDSPLRRITSCDELECCELSKTYALIAVFLRATCASAWSRTAMLHSGRDAQKYGVAVALSRRRRSSEP